MTTSAPHLYGHRSDYREHLRDHEENEAVVKDEAHNPRPVPARCRHNAELDRREREDGEVEAHGVDERRREDLVVRVRDRTSLAWHPLGVEEDSCASTSA